MANWFTRMFRRTDPGHERAAGSTYEQILTQSPYRTTATVYSGAMSIPAAWRASTLIADTLAALPWHAFRERGNRPVERVDSLLLDQPSPYEPRVNTLSSLFLDLVYHGNAIAIIASRDYDGRPNALVPVPAEEVSVRRRDDGSIEYQIRGQVFEGYDVMHVKGHSRPGDVRGFGVLEAHMRTLDLADDLNRQAQNLTGYGVPTGVLRSSNPDLTREEAQELKQAWLNSQRNRTVAVLNASTEFTPLAWNPTEAQLIEARKFSLTEIALIFGVPMSFLGAEGQSMTYTNSQLEAMSLVKFSLNGFIARMEAALSALLPRGTFVRVNLDALLRADTKTRYDAYSVALSAGFLTVNEVRELEDLKPLPEPKEVNSGGDEDDDSPEAGSEAA